MDSHPDVKVAVDAGLTTAYDHFIAFGVNEGRSPLSFFDADAYLHFNPDVKSAVDAGLMTAIEHLLRHGKNEGRQITPFVNLGEYLDANPDVKDAVKNGITNALDHLLMYGVGEGRPLGNGVDLADFMNDRFYRDSLVEHRPDEALFRVSEVAPFLGNFAPPTNWHFPPSTEIPLDYIPPTGTYLYVPPEITIPPGTTLPAWFFTDAGLPSSPPGIEKPKDEESGGDDPGGEETGSEDPTGEEPSEGDGDECEEPKAMFTVAINAEGIVSFSGSGTGEVEVSILDGKLEFTRDGVSASNKEIQLTQLAAANAFQGVPVAITEGLGEWFDLEQATRLRNIFDLKGAGYNLSGPLAELAAGPLNVVDGAAQIHLCDPSVELDWGGRTVQEVKKIEENGEPGSPLPELLSREVELLILAVNRGSIAVENIYFVWDSMERINNELSSNPHFLDGLEYKLTNIAGPSGSIHGRYLTVDHINFIEGAMNADNYSGYSALINMLHDDGKFGPEGVESWVANNPKLQEVLFSGNIGPTEYSFSDTSTPLKVILRNSVDTFIAGSGDDRISGGNGGDILTGGAGADQFVIYDANESNAMNADKITDFDPTQGDRILLVDASFVSNMDQAIDNGVVLVDNARVWRPAGPKSISDRLEMFFDMEANITHIYVDVNLNRTYNSEDFHIQLSGDFTEANPRDIFEYSLA